MDKVLFAHNSGDWETPQVLFDSLNKEFTFTLDVCASKENAKNKKGLLPFVRQMYYHIFIGAFQCR